MNFLGHIFLSGENDQLMIGNFIADYVKGKMYHVYPPEVQKGILLHRSIDTFTDKNPNFQLLRKQLRPLYNHYSGVVADLFIDHFLAANWSGYSPVSLPHFTQKTYATLKENYDLLPLKIQGFFSNLVERDRLRSYAEISGIEEALMIMAYHTSLPAKSAEATQLLRNNYDEFKTLSAQFLSEVIFFCKQKP